MESLLKNISIRGRLAYGVTCLQNGLTAFNIDDDIFNAEILPQIWEFTVSQDFEAWDEATRKINPIFLKENNGRNDNLCQFYKMLPPFIVDMISEVIEIGGSNLYGGTEQFSPHSLKPLITVIRTCEKHRIPLPELINFQKSLFGEAHGWGIPRDKSFFIS